jgi:hypothetical protein
MSDLNDLVPTSDTIDVVLKHPNTGEVLTNDDDGSQMTITIYAPHTRKYKSAIYKQANSRIKKAGGKIENVEFDFEDLEQASIELFSSVTKEWNITFGGDKPKLTATKAKEVYEKIFWIKPQIEEAVASYADFTKV